MRSFLIGIRVWDYPKGLPQQASACEGTSKKSPPNSKEDGGDMRDV